MEDFQSMKHLRLEPIPADCNPNMLAEIFRRQGALRKKYLWHEDFSQEQQTKVYAQAICSESQEIINHTNWKPWKETKKAFDREEVIYEYIDVLHFVIDGLLSLNVTSEQAMQYYLAKNKENHDRIGRNY